MKLADARNVVADGEQGTYNIGFPGDFGPDETQFDAETFEELEQLWEDFCEENDLDPELVDYLEREDFPEEDE